jgi:hypothetical protein
MVGVWSETEGGADAGVRAEYGLQYGWAASDEGGTHFSTLAGLSEDAEGELWRRRQVRGAWSPFSVLSGCTTFPFSG